MFGKSKRNAAHGEPLLPEEKDEQREMMRILKPQLLEGATVTDSARRQRKKVSHPSVPAFRLSAR